MKWLICLGCCILSLNATSESLPKIALIIDDIGYNLSRDKQLADLRLPITLSILPDFNHSKKIAEYSHNLGIEVMLHLPMESSSGFSMGHIGLSLDMNDDEKQKVLELALSEVPHAVGVNNHMGSLLTEDLPAMNWLMAELEQRQLFFVDSLTAPNSVAANVARDSGLVWGRRHVFLDNNKDPEYLNSQFQEAIRIARIYGQVILIGHPYQETLDFIKLRLPLAMDFDQVQFVPVSDVLHSPVVSTALNESN